VNIAREPRIKVTIRATLRAGQPRMDVCIRDISPRGLMMMAATPPAPGTYVEVLGIGQTIVGRVTWSKDRRFGVRTSDRIDLSAAIFGGAAQTQDQNPSSPPARSAAGRRDDRKNAASSRAFGRALQFTVIATVAVALSAALALATYDTLSKSLGRVSTQLGGDSRRR
jgi:hypothetical protein